MNFSDFLIWCFWAWLEVICKISWKKGHKTSMILQWLNSSDFLIWCFFLYFEVISKKIKKGIIIWPSRSNKTAIFSHFCSFRTLKFFQVIDFYDFNMMFLGMFRSDNWENCPKFGLVFAYSLRKNKHHSGDLSSTCLLFLNFENIFTISLITMKIEPLKLRPFGFFFKFGIKLSK